MAKYLSDHRTREFLTCPFDVQKNDRKISAKRSRVVCKQRADFQFRAELRARARSLTMEFYYFSIIALPPPMGSCFFAHSFVRRLSQRKGETRCRTTHTANLFGSLRPKRKRQVSQARCLLPRFVPSVCSKTRSLFGRRREMRS